MLTGFRELDVVGRLNMHIPTNIKVSVSLLNQPTRSDCEPYLVSFPS